MGMGMEYHRLDLKADLSNHFNFEFLCFRVTALALRAYPFEGEIYYNSLEQSFHTIKEYYYWYSHGKVVTYRTSFAEVQVRISERVVYVVSQSSHTYKLIMCMAEMVARLA
ncbi:hypothetical protein Avbf_12533 [Armadillidium vulgare]|nr:hypothetical protein Avbf_12533 [Armadillidium vulgare]